MRLAAHPPAQRASPNRRRNRPAVVFCGAGGGLAVSPPRRCLLWPRPLVGPGGGGVPWGRGAVSGVVGPPPGPCRPPGWPPLRPGAPAASRGAKAKRTSDDARLVDKAGATHSTGCSSTRTACGARAVSRPPSSIPTVRRTRRTRSHESLGLVRKAASLHARQQTRRGRRRCAARFHPRGKNSRSWPPPRPQPEQRRRSG